ncbi:aminotransferase class V-fold PLP-dependent enzyme [Micromonospora sp. BRA006-A]|nr:aminotransferase class V-fold PLP-dependent enzyme [Micromonospora sp. BRA006-A]
MLDVLAEHYALHNANVSRSVHTLGTEATEAYEGARGRRSPRSSTLRADEVVFTKNSTEAINLVAYAFSNASLRADGDPASGWAPATRS